MRQLLLIYGPPRSGKTTAAWQVARGMTGKTAVISVDQLLAGSIAVPDMDVEAEFEMVHVQVRLLAANYLKNGYNVVIEGPFVFEREGRLFSYEREIGEIPALMRNLATSTLTLRLRTSPETLTERSDAATAASAQRIQDAYVEAFSRRLVLDSDTLSPTEIAAKVRAALDA